MKGILRHTPLLFLGLIMPVITCGQDIPFGDYSRYPFISIRDNTLELADSAVGMDVFFEKLSQCQLKGKGRVKILHIGDSHVQADFFTGRTRQRFHQSFPGCNAGMNLVFPYKAAKTNSSYVYTSEANGEWISCRNIMSDRTCTLGVTGISLTTTDSSASLSFRMRRQLPLAYFFNRMSVMILRDSASFSISVPGFQYEGCDTLGLAILYHFSSPQQVDSTSLFVRKDDSTQKQLTLLGILLDSGDEGILYNSAGINGADVRSFLRCSQMNSDLAYLSPDLVIVSLGTNDCYSEKWDSVTFEMNLRTLARNIRQSVPSAAIIFTTPPDHYRKRKHLNEDVPAACNAIYRVARSEKAAVWNLYRVMGGRNSIREWIDSNLAVRDRIHFNSEGYYLQGDLLFEAIIQSWSDYLDKQYVAGTNR